MQKNLELRVLQVLLIFFLCSSIFFISTFEGGVKDNPKTDI